MAMKTLLERLDITQEELEQRYKDAGNLRRLAEVLGCSKTTLQKYLKDVAHDTKPWSSIEPHSTGSANKDYLRRRYRREVMEHLERELQTRRIWQDIRGRRIPREAIEVMTAHPPRKLVPIIPVYGTLKGTGEIAVFMFEPAIDWISRQPTVPTSSAGAPDSLSPAPSYPRHQETTEPEDSPEQTDE